VGQVLKKAQWCSAARLTNPFLCEGRDVARPRLSSCRVNTRVCIAQIILKDRDDMRLGGCGRNHTACQHERKAQQWQHGCRRVCVFFDFFHSCIRKVHFCLVSSVTQTHRHRAQGNTMPRLWGGKKEPDEAVHVRALSALHRASTRAKPEF
jgi:hypothetical protein